MAAGISGTVRVIRAAMFQHTATFGCVPVLFLGLVRK